MAANSLKIISKLGFMDPLSILAMILIFVALVMQINGAKLRHRLHRSFDKIAQPKELLTPQNDYIYGNNPGKPSDHPES
jgi:hypothetical protein